MDDMLGKKPPTHIMVVDRELQIVNAIVHLWLAFELLDQAEENVEACNVHLPLERLCLKYNLPLAEAEAYANLGKLN